jgi:hypothetical protein
MKVAILGWGSLLWEGGPEFDRWHTEWMLDGPTLKLEFSRISKKRLGALTLVIDDEHGMSNIVAWCFSKRTNLQDALCDLRAREGTTLDKIGQLVLSPQTKKPAAAHQPEPIEVWARARKLDAVVWTALKSDFKEKTTHAFSVPAATAYLQSLPADAKAKAAEYIWRAPDLVKTPLRAAMLVPPWFL